MTIDLDTAAAQLNACLQDAPYLNYVYSYPHKTAYRALAEPLDIGEVWSAENKQALFLYVHLPFCEMRCGYCNLFTTTQAPDALVMAYLGALERQMQVAADYLGDFRFEQLAIGGGTPTYLSAVQLEHLFTALSRHLQAKHLPASVEVSPATVDADRLACLQAQGTERISIGIESFNPEDLQALGRPQSLAQVQKALALIRDSGIPRLNIDLIYGNHGQTPARWLASLEQALAWQPEELFIYPLYIRPLTGLGRKQQQAQADQRQLLYRLACERLLAAGYHQGSMRLFRRGATPQQGQYRCQEDGMVGLGAGARSYTQSWHYSSRYAVGKGPVQAIIRQYADRSAATLRMLDYGIRLDAREQRHRYVLLSLLQVEGLAAIAYQQRFGSRLLDDFPQLVLLEEKGLASVSMAGITLTEQGLAASDLIGHWLFSAAVRQRMVDWEWA